MWKKIAIAGTTAAVIAGAGTAALAETGSTSTPPSNAASANTSAVTTAAANTKAAKRHPGLARLRNLQHGTWVTGKGDSADVTHDIIRGKVTAVSSTAVTVKSADNTTQTYQVTADTKIHTRAKHTGATIGDVKAGDTVTVSGTGSSAVSGATLTAKQVLDTTK
jgi:hypothetical protein